MNKNKAIISTLIFIVLVLISVSSFAESISPYASDTISNYTMHFSSNKTITLYCVTYSACTISANINVYKYNETTGSWGSPIKSETVKVYNATTLSTDKTYSEIKNGGTYKVSVTYSAGGDSRTLSAQRSF